MAKSDLDHLVGDLRPGDQVVIRDTKQNYLEGEVKHIGDHWTIKAFGVDVEFARDRGNGLGPAMRPGVHIAGHIAQLINKQEV